MDSDGNYINVEDIGPRPAAGFHIESDKKGGIYLSGAFLYNNYFAGFQVTGPTSLSWKDAFLCKMDTSLATQWVNTVSGSFNNYGESVAVSDNYIYMTGFFAHTSNFSGTPITYNGNGTTTGTINSSRDAYVTKYDFDGNMIWVKTFGGIDKEYAYGIAVSPNDDVYFGGIFEDTVIFENTQITSKGGTDIFVAKLNPNGDVVWAKSQGGVTDDYLYCIGIDSVQNVYCGGTYSITQDFDQVTMVTQTNNYSGLVAKLRQHMYSNTTLSTTSFCEGDTVKLCVNSITSPLTYQFNLSTNGWVVDNQYYFIASTTNTLINGNIIVSNNIYSDTLIINENINTYANFLINLGNDISTCNYNTVTLNGLSNQESYLWSTGEISQSIDVNTTDIYWVEITNSNNCISSDTIQVDFVDCAFINENDQNSKLVYYRNNKLEIFTELSNFSVAIYTITGELILNSKNKNIIPLTHLKNGAYFIIFNGSSSQSKKIIINN